VFGCDPALMIVNATTHAGVNVQWQPIVGSTADLLGSIRAFKPNMLHVYAHGVADYRPSLPSATSPMRTRAKTGPSAGRQGDPPEGDPDDNICHHSLNACETAAISKQARSLACSWCASLPAVIGMRSCRANEARLRRSILRGGLQR
jgi:hypothetical protein